MSRKIYLIRHGKIKMDREKRYIGITDLPLCMEGIAQSMNLKNFFSSIYIEKVYLSPMKRCIQTSDIIIGNRNVPRVKIKELMEINLGKWEGKSFKYIKKFFPEEFKKRGENIDTFVPKGGESFKQLQTRVVPAVENIIKQTTGNVLIIAHLGVNRVIIGNILGISLSDIFRIRQNYGCINELVWNDKNGFWLKKEFNLNMILCEK
ncbi:histidine phosphatase family protein [Clostridium tyrobutyricum]|uniref:histidine phosphatase family protein n=1 Tax=Clostridium tyrobutyricum TaxID=1519 RepID=UPI00057E004D|nr:histidine phosphatase family protein [Clostridium tyrobutyricum]